MSLIGTKVKLLKPKEFGDVTLSENVSEVIFEGEIMGGNGKLATFVGLQRNGELVLDNNYNLRLFFWSEPAGLLPNNFEVVNEQ